MHQVRGTLVNTEPQITEARINATLLYSKTWKYVLISLDDMKIYALNGNIC